MSDSPQLPAPAPEEVEVNLARASVHPSLFDPPPADDPTQPDPAREKRRQREKVAYIVALGWLETHGLACEWPRREPEPPAPEKKQRKGAPQRRRRQTFGQHSKGVAPAGERRLVSRRMSEVSSRPVSWLWRGRFPLGRVCFLLGRQGRGKSTYVHWFAATVANGLPLPDCKEPCPRGSVIILTAEENAEEDIKYRYEAMGLDASKIHVIDGVDCGDESSAMFALARDVPLLVDKVEEIGDVKLIVIDPIGSYTHGINQRDDSEVRALLDQLIRLADEKGVCVLMVASPLEERAEGHPRPGRELRGVHAGPPDGLVPQRRPQGPLPAAPEPAQVEHEGRDPFGPGRVVPQGATDLAPQTDPPGRLRGRPDAPEDRARRDDVRKAGPGRQRGQVGEGVHPQVPRRERGRPGSRSSSTRPSSPGSRSRVSGRGCDGLSTTTARSPTSRTRTTITSGSSSPSPPRLRKGRRLPRRKATPR